MNFTSSQVLVNFCFSFQIHGFYGHSGDMKVKLNSRSTRVRALLSQHLVSQTIILLPDGKGGFSGFPGDMKHRLNFLAATVQVLIKFVGIKQPFQNTRK